MVVKFAVFVINLKPSNIFSLIVIMLVFSGVQFIGCLVFTAPTNVSHLFGVWSKSGRRKCWAIWLTRNDFVFNKSQKQTFLQVLFRGTYWLRFWTQLQRLDEHKTSIVETCRLLESSAMFLFASHEWSFSYRLGH